MASTSDSLYVTYVDIDRDLLKIWGQGNRIGATYIERQLLQLLPEFNRARSPNPVEIQKGMFCFAKYTDENYYRARIISRVQNDSVGVLFVDYGNKDVIKLSNIRIQEGKEGDVLTKMSEQAEEYYLARIIAPTIGWTKEIVSEIRRDICYDEFLYKITSQVGDQKIVELQFHGEDFSNYLVKKKLANPLSLPVQREMILSYCSLVSNEVKPDPAFKDLPRMSFSPSVPLLNMRAPFRPSNDGMMANTSRRSKTSVNFPEAPPGIQYPSPQNMSPSLHHARPSVPRNLYFPPVSHPSNSLPINPSPPQPADTVLNPLLVNNQLNPLHLVKENANSFNYNNNIIQLLAQQVKEYIAEDNAKTESKMQSFPHHYVNSVLEVGSTYNVITSYVDDGPWSFSIQLMSSETELRELMDELSLTELVPIKPPIILGHPCIASSALYGNLCRGVVVSISHSAVKVYFVDFGNTEDLPASSIYELPPKFFKIRVLSQKFSLSGLQKVAYSDDIRKFFKEVVQDELLMLRVTSLEDDNLPTCELYLKNVNIKRILNEKIREQRSCIQEYFPKPGDTENVCVTWVVSPQKFFVQLMKRDTDLKALKAELAEVEKKGQRLTYKQLSVGFKCVCRFESDGHWYRAVITSVDSENAITVFYVDYGNTETVNISFLRRIDSPGLINQMNNQAIQCSLKGYENKPFDQEVTNKLESLVLEKELQMTVVSSEKELLCVQLLENQQDISVLLQNTVTRKLDSFDTSSKEDGWNSLSGGSSITTFEKEKVSENSDSHEKKDIRSFRHTKTRGENKSSRPFSHFESLKSPAHSTPTQSKSRLEEPENWRESKDKNNHWREDKDKNSHWREDKDRNSNWREDKDKNSHWREDKDKDNNWREKSDYQNTRKPRIIRARDNDWDNNGNSKFNSNRGIKQERDDWSENMRTEKSRTFRQDRTRDNRREYNAGDRKKFDENRGKREGKRFERSLSRDTLREEDLKFNFDRNDNATNDRVKSLRKPIRKDEAASPGTKFEDMIVNIGDCERGIITYYFSPDEFYVQLLAQEEEFTKMMKDIQKYYSDKYSIRDPLQAGDIVIAQFSVDKVLYRAEVIKPSPVTVCYVDYGNHEPVGPKSTWLVNKEFLKLPKQVVKCRLSNLSPIGTYWPPPGEAVDKFFALSEYKCTFVGKENNFFEITMEDPNGKDVASEIIAAGFGRKQSPVLDIPEIDFTLLPNQILRLYVSHVESSSKFYVILNPEGLAVIEKELKTLYEDKRTLIRLKEDLIKPGTVCLSTIDEISWCRGKIIKTEGNKISVWFCDKGDCAEVTADKLMNLPEYLTVFQPQAIWCSLHGTSTIKNEEFIRAIKHKHHFISIISSINESLSVILYNKDGQKYDFQTGDNFPQSIEPVGHLPIFSQKLWILISHYENPKEMYIQRWENDDEVNELSELMDDFYSEEKEGFDIGEASKEQLVAAYSLVYKTWYRARLMSSSEKDVNVFYIDFGNKENLPREMVKKLDTSFLSSHAFAKKVILNIDFNLNKIEDIQNYLINICNNKNVLGYFKHYNGELVFDIVVDEKRVSQSLKGAGLALIKGSDIFADVFSDESSKEAETIAETPVSNVNVDLKVLISHIDSPNQFWVHKETLINDLHQFQEKLKQQCDVLPAKETVAVGDVVAAIYSDTWYRAKVTNIKDNNIKVQFIDYGNTFSVDLTSGSVKKLTEEFLKVPVFATQFALKGNWNENSTAKFEEIVLQNEDFITAVILEESDPAIVDLFQNGQSIAELLMEEGSSHLENYDIIYIAHFDSPYNFYIHREMCFDLYNKLNERIADVSKFSDVFSVKTNKVYLVKYPEDGAWYRAKIIHKFKDEIEAYFIDYGNKSIVTEFKSLPDDLIDIPHLAENCCLVYGDNNDTWSKEACVKFAEYADGRELKMKVIVKRNNLSVVELFDGNSNISKELEVFCENDNRTDVFISYALSPLDFYIQYVDDEDYKFIAQKLNGEGEDLEDITVGVLCQARYEDGLWYRARVGLKVKDGYEVFFIDFGNDSVSAELKVIPPEIEDIPPRALKCALELQDRNVSERVKEEFISLAAGGTTVFKGRIIFPGKVNIISLKLNGRLLEETLNEDEISDGSSFGLDSDEASDFTETDDGKNSKKNYDDYFSNLENDLSDRESVHNETDEEKRVKFAQYDGCDGFKSDDEKGTPAASGFVNATDNELMEETWDRDDHFLESDIDDDVISESKKKFSVENGESDRIINGVENTRFENENRCKTSRNKVHKIVPGSISRGEEAVTETCTKSHLKLKYSDKLVPGSISRGISLESMAKESEFLEDIPVKEMSKSAPNTPKPERRTDLQSYVKIDPNDKVVPGCISTGVPLHITPASEKIPRNDKIVSGAVNGSSEDF